MEENNNYIFNDVVGKIQCKFDGKLWYFDNNEVKENMIIPIKSVSNVQLTKVRSWIWLIILIFAIAAAITGIFIEEEGDVLFYGLAIILGLIAIILFIFSVEYTLSIIPHSGIAQKIVTRKRNALNNLLEALENSLKKNF
ncbi:MAG: hypothetical protein J6T80_04155 [Paludibacteraceae bacterium]|nr:hypothetical protein [Paludibacteraceae bacterium]